jgi:hypothetical protein
MGLSRRCYRNEDGAPIGERCVAVSWINITPLAE